MKFSIVTPSYKQLDWLRLCVASVRDQVEGVVSDELRVASDKVGNAPPATRHPSPLSVEHIIQDAGTLGIEEFAREIGADFYRDGKLQFASVTSEELSVASEQSPSHFTRHTLPATRNYRIAVYIEADSGMYDAINRGLRRGSGDLCAWLNCDEQYVSGALELVSRAFEEHPEWQVLLGDTVLLDENLEPRSYRIGVPPPREYIQEFQLNMHSSSLFFRRELLEQGYWLGNRFRSIGDSEWVARMMDGGVRIHRFPHLLSTFILGSANLSAAQVSLDEKEVWRKEQQLGKWKAGLSKVFYGLHRGLLGGFVPRRKGLEIFTPADLTSRRKIPPRWLDFRFRA